MNQNDLVLGGEQHWFIEIKRDENLMQISLNTLAQEAVVIILSSEFCTLYKIERCGIVASTPQSGGSGFQARP
jgi:hypothetical protein